MYQVDQIVKEKSRVRYQGHIWTVSKIFKRNSETCYRLVRNEGLTKYRHHITDRDMFDMQVLGKVVEQNTFSENYEKDVYLAKSKCYNSHIKTNTKMVNRYEPNNDRNNMVISSNCN